MERWVEAVLSPTDQAKCDLLGVRVMKYVGVFDVHDPVYSRALGSGQGARGVEQRTVDGCEGRHRPRM